MSFSYVIDEELKPGHSFAQGYPVVGLERTEIIRFILDAERFHHHEIIRRLKNSCNWNHCCLNTLFTNKTSWLFLFYIHFIVSFSLCKEKLIWWDEIRALILPSWISVDASVGRRNTSECFANYFSEIVQHTERIKASILEYGFQLGSSVTCLIFSLDLIWHMKNIFEFTI